MDNFEREVSDFSDPETDAELKKKFNDAISSMKADGSLNKLLVEWFGDGMLLYD